MSMKRIETILGLGILSTLVFSACSTQKKIVNTMPPEAISAQLPCFKPRYQSNPKALFGSGMGESLDGENAHRKASLDSKSKISSQIDQLLNRVIREYDKRAHLSGEQIADLRIVASRIANTQRGRLNTVCMRHRTNDETGKTNSYLAKRIRVHQVVKAFERLAKKDPAMLDYKPGEMHQAVAAVLQEAFLTK